VPKKVWVERDGSRYLTTVWVLPEEAESSVVHTAQLDLFAEQEIADYENKRHIVSQLPTGATIKYTLNGVKKTGEIAKTEADSVTLADGNKVAISNIDVVLPTKNPQVVHRAIASATPENRGAVTAALFGSKLQEPDIQPEYDFTPEITKEGLAEVLDYRKVVPLKISFVPEKDILNKPRPSWIPEISDKYFSRIGYRIEAIKIGENDYSILLESNQDSARYARVNLEVLAATQDYYLKRAKANRAIEHKLRQKRLPPIRVLPRTRITMRTTNMAYVLLGRDMHKALNAINAALDDMHQKSDDMNIQLEEYINSYVKGEETSYGDKGVNKDLLDMYGVLVKRQNGDAITKQEISEIKKALDDVFAVYGDRSEMARKFGLKISHSGYMLMHARKLCGIYFPIYHAIGVTMMNGPQGFGFTLAHEWAHFMDNYLGLKGGKYRYASDDWNSLSGQIAKKFREKMAVRQNSEHINQTNECFARAFEQYFATKRGESDDFQKSTNKKGEYCKQDVFEKDIEGLIDKWFKDNDALLKSMFSKR
jgi:hypothetical protein